MRARRTTSVSQAERQIFASPGRTASAMLLAAALGACSSGSDAPRAKPEPDGGTPVPDAGPSTAVCNAPGYAEPSPELKFSGLSATVVDENGDPAPDVSAQACGINLCINGKTDANGVARIPDRTSLTKPAFKYGGGQLYARWALPLALPASDALALGEQRTVAFDPPAQGATIEPGGSATSRTATLAFADDMTMKVDPFDFDTDELLRFRSAVVPEGTWPEVVDRSLDFVLLVAMTPSDAELCPAAKLTLENTAGLAAGTRVEFFVHGTDIIERWAPYGGWAKVSDGAVSADGEVIETDPSGGIPVLTIVGVRVAE